METRNTKNNFDIFKLKGKLAKIRDWMTSHHIPPKLLFYILGILSTMWFLIRVIPKTSRASYPSMRVAAPFMFGMIVYLLSVGGITAVSRMFKQKIIDLRFASTFLLVFTVVVTMAITPSEGEQNAQNVPVSSEKNANIAETKTIPAPVENTKAVDNKGVKITSVIYRSFSEGFKTTNFRSIIAADDNIKWFLTDAGIVHSSINWIIHNDNSKVPYANLRNFIYNLSPEGPELFIAGPNGATIAYLSLEPTSNGVTYSTENSGISSNNVFSTAIGKNQVRWIATDKGISALINGKWLKPSYNVEYPESMFKDFPITAMATTQNGDSLYAATAGAGVTRVYKNKVDGISGASQYAQWGPIDMPSDSVLSICIAPNGDQWFGTTLGVALHTGYNTLENWTVFKTENGLINNVVQSIAIDPEGKIWFGTKGGISVFDGTIWSSFTTKDGLISNNILCISVDKNGLIYFGTDNGVMTYNNLNGQLVCFK
jgi:hypothetical protein